MPTIEELFKSDQYKSLRVESPNKDKSFGTQLKNFVLQDRLTGGPRTLLLKSLPIIYGAELYRLEKQLSNPFERGLAVQGAYYNDPSKTPTAPKGFNLAAAMGGTANRPSDTIFENPDAKGAINTLGLRQEKFQNHSDLINSVEAGKSYWVSRAPAEVPWYAGALKGTPNDMKDKAIGLLMSQAKKEIGKMIDKGITKLSKKKSALKPIKSKKDTAPNPTAPPFEYYVPGYFTDANGKSNDLVKNKNFTDFVREDGKLSLREGKENIIYTGISKELNKAGAMAASGQKGDRASQFDLINQDILNTLSYENETKLKSELLDNIEGTDGQQTVLIIKPYGKNHSIVFPGAITGISEDLTPEWSDFKYLGSPFKSYKYNGVERSLKFELKMYYTTSAEKIIMIQKLNELKSLVFPYDEITTMTYQTEDKNNKAYNHSQLAYSGNFIELTLGGLYKNMFGFVDSLSTSIEDNVVWASNSQDKNDKPYPSVVNVAFSMKIIESPKIEDGKNTKVFKYDFDGLTNLSK